MFGHGMATVTGAPKLAQDLTCAVLEPEGTDSLHPSYGSTIGGGTTPDGTFQRGVIGNPNDSVAASFVDAELRRIIAQYQSEQQARYQTDIATYGKATLTVDEILLAIEDITIQAAQNQMLVGAKLRTGAGGVQFAAPVSVS